MNTKLIAILIFCSGYFISYIAGLVTKTLMYKWEKQQIKKQIEKTAGELVEHYFLEYGGVTCSWRNVTLIIEDLLEKNNCLYQ